MSALQLPPGEPPADAVAWLREQFEALQAYEDEALVTVSLLRSQVQELRDAGLPSSVATFRGLIELELALRRVEKIREERAQLARDAREHGLQP